MANVTLSPGIRNNLLSLQSTKDLLNVTQNRLATGRKVNSALDDPLNYFVSQGLNARSGDLSRLLDGIGQGIKTLEAADNGITAMTKLIQTAQAGARTALQSNSTTARMGSGTDPVTKKAVDYAATPNLVGPGGKFQAGDTFTVSGTDDTGAAFTFPVALGAAPYTAQNLVDAVNSSAPGAAGTISARVDVAGRLIVDNVKGGTLRVALSTDTGAVNTLADLFGTYEAPSTTATATDTGVIAPALNTARAGFAQQYNDLIAQVSGLARDSSYNGTNLLNGQSLDMVFNEDATTRLVVRGVVLDAAGLGLTTLDTKFNFQSDVEVNAALAKLDAAVKQLRSQAATFGANMTVAQTRQDFTKSAVKTLQVGADNLTLADTNEEGANLLALQTRQQLSVQALSLANQSDQAVLRLFQ
jgi:flagellin